MIPAADDFPAIRARMAELRGGPPVVPGSEPAPDCAFDPKRCQAPQCVDPDHCVALGYCDPF